MRSTLLCTVGTSLFGNLKQLKRQDINDKPNNWEEIISQFDQENWPRLAKLLLDFDPWERICGAEINTIYEARKKNWLDLKNLVFLVSDTKQGRNTGYLLKSYFENHKELTLGQIEIKEVSQLQDKEPSQFKTKGLRNLVRDLGSYIQRSGQDQVAIDATGGYKAQIAVAVLMGQALNIPVYYKHELFKEIIDFPPLPISLDFDILGNNAALLSEFEKGATFSDSDFQELDEKLRVFLTEIYVENEALYELNAIGQLYLTTFRLRYPKAINLTNANEQERKVPTFGKDHHYPNEFKAFVNKVWEENKWVKTCYTISYAGQKQIKGIEFYVASDGLNDQLIGTFKHKDFGARFVIRLTDESRQSLNWAALRLNEIYSKN